LSADSPITSPVPPTPPGLETGRYCVLSTGHLSVATAELLDRWCRLAPHDQLIGVAPGRYGWFVPTLDIDGGAAAAIPDDLDAALVFGRRHGFDYLLFDCDARTVSELATYDW
jgi:hypothetical protein